jgi:subtilisin family serine protease
VPPGEGQVKLFNKSGRQTEVHLYFPDSDAGHFKTGVENRYLVSSPGTAESVITVGGSAWNDNIILDGKPSTLLSICKDEKDKSVPIAIGWLSCYSSPGPTRDNRLKPDIVAPSEWYIASYSANSGENWTSDSTGMYIAMNGTSAATPYTAGVIALLFEKDPSLTTNRIKDLFRQNSTKNGLKPFLGNVPNNDWGDGKLDFAAVERIFAALDDQNVSAK